MQKMSQASNVNICWSSFMRVNGIFLVCGLLVEDILRCHLGIWEIDTQFFYISGYFMNTIIQMLKKKQQVS